MSRSFAGLASSPWSLSLRRPASMVVSATWASRAAGANSMGPSTGRYLMLAQASSSMAAMAVLTLAFCGIVIE